MGTGGGRRALQSFPLVSPSGRHPSMATVADLANALVRMGSGSADPEAFSGVVNFMAARWDIPIVFVVGYLLMVYATRDKIRPHSCGGVVDASFAAWNLGLSL